MAGKPQSRHLLEAVNTDYNYNSNKNIILYYSLYKFNLFTLRFRCTLASITLMNSCLIQAIVSIHIEDLKYSVQDIV